MVEGSDPGHTLLGPAVHQAGSSQADDHLPRLPRSVPTYKLRLEPSISDPPSYDDVPKSRVMTAPLSPIIGTLAVLGRKPCQM
ncbi:hypothetical protein ACI65C_008308 [Semiaphis heraclei]